MGNSKHCQDNDKCEAMKIALLFKVDIKLTGMLPQDNIREKIQSNVEFLV